MCRLNMKAGKLMDKAGMKIPTGLHRLFFILSGILAILCEIIFFRHIEKKPVLHILIFIFVPVVFFAVLRFNYWFTCYLREKL